MDVAHMILDIAKHEANQKRAEIKISFGYDVLNNEQRVPKTYTITVMAHPKEKSCYLVEYRNAKFKHSRGKAGHKHMEELFKQLCKRYMTDTDRYIIDHEDYVRIQVSYMGEELASDSHTVCGVIELDDLSLSSNAPEENYEVDDLLSFFMSYYALVQRIEL